MAYCLRIEMFRDWKRGLFHARLDFWEIFFTGPSEDKIELRLLYIDLFNVFICALDVELWKFQTFS